MEVHRLSRPVLLIACALALGLSGCGRPAERVAAPPPLTAESTASVDATAPSSPVTTSVPSGEQPEDSSVPIRSNEVEALENELKAIERELESLDMPSDSDFQDIEGSLGD